MNSNWEMGKLRSEYHFDPFQNEPVGYAYQYCGRFIGDWDKELREAIDNVKPVTWGTRSKTYHLEYPGKEEEEHDLLQAGMSTEQVIFRKQFDLDEKFNRMCDVLGLLNNKKALHVQFPGELINIHVDKQYEMNEDPQRVRRFFIMLDDWKPGQFIIFGNNPMMQWKAGEIFTFDWMSMPHATANASWEPRPLIQITGTITDKTLDFLTGFKKELTI